MKDTLMLMLSKYQTQIAEGDSLLRFMGFEAVGECKGCYVVVNVETGECVTDVVFEDHGEFSDGVAPVEVNGLWGYIKENGEFLIEPMYIVAEESVKGVLHVKDEHCNHFLLCAKNGEFIGSDIGFHSVEFLGERDDVYLVGYQGLYGILDCNGAWLSNMRCDWIEVISDELVWLKDSGVVRNIDTGKTLVKATALDKSFLSEFGVFSCYDAERNQTEFFKIGEGYIESLFVEAGHQASLKMKTPDIIFGALTKWEGTSHSMSCAMFSISNRKWLYKGLNNIEYNQGDDFEYYELQNGSKKGLADVNGALLIDVVMNKYQYCKGNFIVAIDDKWCLYNVAERRLVLPLADALYNISTTDFQGYIFVKTEKEKWRKRKVYRYLLDGKFISDYEYTYAFRYRKQGDLWLAQVRRRDGKFGWIDTDGEFIADLPGEYDLAK